MSGARDQNRIQPVDPDHATGAIGRFLAEIRTKFALVPNLFEFLRLRRQRLKDSWA